MKLDKLLAEIRETNLVYLTLAQEMIREDKAEAIQRLGISEQIADLIASLTLTQIQKVASCNFLLCRFSFDDRIIWELITSHRKDLRLNELPSSNSDNKHPADSL